MVLNQWWTRGPFEALMNPWTLFPVKYTHTQKFACFKRFVDPGHNSAVNSQLSVNTGNGDERLWRRNNKYSQVYC